MKKMASKTWRLPSDLIEWIKEKATAFPTESDFVRELIAKAKQADENVPKKGAKLFSKNRKIPVDV